MEIRFFAPGKPGQQSRFRREHLRQWRRSVSAGERRRARCRALDRPHRLRDRWRRISWACRRRTSDCRTVDEATERQKRDGMCWTRRGRAVQRRRRLQGDLPRRARRDGHDHRRQLLRLLQEGSEDADQLRGESFRPVRGGACRRRASRSRATCLGQDFYADRTVLLKKAPLRRCDAPARRARRCQAGRLRGRPALSRHRLRARRTPSSTCAKAPFSWTTAMA